MRVIRSVSLLSAVVILAAGANAVRAATIPGLYPTGVDNSYNLLSGGSPDPHYTTGGSPDYVLSTSNLWPSWPTSSTGKWINYIDSTNTVGTFTFQTTFDLTGFDPSTAQISGVWTPDNGATMYLNGNPVESLDWNAFSSLHDFSITSGFQPGINTLSITIGMDTWDGLLISQISGTADATAVPLPPAMLTGLPTLALAGLAFWRRKR